ncbi:MAG TPA: PqqD family protein [Polyangiaceae bacterium]|nr:PqqD family protein [Polyangiaceae bacterium]
MTPNQPRTKLSGPVRLLQNERTACRVIDGKAVVITIDENQVHVLNSVGTRVWQLADGRPLDAIVDAIVDEFEVERAQAAHDVCSFAERLVAVGAARVAEERPE